MKKAICLVLTLVLLCSFAACSKSTENQESSASSDTAALQPQVVVSEKGYVSMLNDLTTNADNYIGQVVQIEGMYTLQDFSAQGGKIYYYVYREGAPACPTCPANMCGLEFTTSDGKYPDYVPKDGDANSLHPWIKVTGTFNRYYEDQNGQQVGPFYTLDNATYEIMTTRGAESV